MMEMQGRKKQNEGCSCGEEKKKRSDLSVCSFALLQVAVIQHTRLVCNGFSVLSLFRMGFFYHWLSSSFEYLSWRCVAPAAEEGSAVALLFAVFCSCAFAMISGKSKKKKKVLGCVAMATPDGAPLDCGCVSRSEPPCKAEYAYCVLTMLTNSPFLCVQEPVFSPLSFSGYWAQTQTNITQN